MFSLLKALNRIEWFGCVIKKGHALTWETGSNIGDVHMKKVAVLLYYMYQTVYKQIEVYTLFLNGLTRA